MAVSASFVLLSDGSVAALALGPRGRGGRAARHRAHGGLRFASLALILVWARVLRGDLSLEGSERCLAATTYALRRACYRFRFAC